MKEKMMAVRSLIVVMLVVLMMLNQLGSSMAVSVSVAARASSLSSPSRRQSGSAVLNRHKLLAQKHYHHHHHHDSGQDETILPQQSIYYTMFQYQSHANLKIKLDGKIQWDYGNPNLYSLFHERLVRNKGTQEQMFMLEATASGHFICMNAKGQFYTVPIVPIVPTQPPTPPHRNKTNDRIRHRWKKRHGWWRRRRRPSSLPDCLFKTYEFKADESYERAVGIYSYPHSNVTHGRFLSRNSKNGKVRSYRRPFISLFQHPQVKISQLPIRYLKELIIKTRFGRQDKYNSKVRQCILQLLKCRAQKERLRREEEHLFNRKQPSKGRKGTLYLRPLIERCKMRVRKDEGPPKCRLPLRPFSQE